MPFGFFTTTIGVDQSVDSTGSRTSAVINQSISSFNGSSIAYGTDLHGSCTGSVPRFNLRCASIFLYCPILSVNSSGKSFFRLSYPDCLSCPLLILDFSSVFLLFPACELLKLLAIVYGLRVVPPISLVRPLR